MKDEKSILHLVNDSPSVQLLALRNKEMVLQFLLQTFGTTPSTISSEQLHLQLCDFLKEYEKTEADSEQESFESRTRNYLNKWTNAGFISNFRNENEEVYYELSSDTVKTLNWVADLEPKEFVGTESKFHAIISQLEELEEYTNESTEDRVKRLETKKTELEKEINSYKEGKVVPTYQEHEITPRIRQLTQSARELISDFKEVERNFKQITKRIYEKQMDKQQSKSQILGYTFNALEELKESKQGKSFYSFWEFLLNPVELNNWNNLVERLEGNLNQKEIDTNEYFLRGVRKVLFECGQRVYKANDKMAEKLSRIIRNKEGTSSEITKKEILEIKRTLLVFSEKKLKTNASLNIETNLDVSVDMDRPLTIEPKEPLEYNDAPVSAETELDYSEQMIKLFSKSNIDTKQMEQRIIELLQERAQITIAEVIELSGGITQGLPEVIGYVGTAKRFNHTFLPNKEQVIQFNSKNNKSIRIPEIIITR